MAKQKYKKPKKIESLDEFLARGGAINRVPEKVRDPAPTVTRNNSAGAPAVFLSLEEADLFYGEAKKGTKPKAAAKPQSKIDLDALPPALRAKFIAKLKEDADGQGYEEELEEIAEDYPSEVGTDGT